MNDTPEETAEDLEEKNAATVKKPADDEQIYNLEDFKILTVDDFPFITDLLASSLRELGVGEVLKADSGQKARNLIMQNNGVESDYNIDVLVLDWLMPDMSGADLLKWVREHPKETIRFLPVIVCSAYTSSALVEEARDSGANEVMVKPVSASKLAERIQHVIDHPRPFVKSPDFFGPNRRRKKEEFKDEEKRVNKDEDIKQSYEKP